MGEQKKLELKLQGEAAKAAQIAALPWQQAKMRSQETMVSYVTQARDLANAVTHLKLIAPEFVQAGWRFAVPRRRRSCARTSNRRQGCVRQGKTIGRASRELQQYCQQDQRR